MTLKGGQRIPIKATDQKISLPVIPAKTVILFPGEIITLQVGRPENIALIEENSSRDHLVAVVYSPRGETAGKDLELCRVGTAAHIIAVKDGPGGSKLISLEGASRIALENIHRKTPYMTALVGNIEETPAPPEKAAELTRQIISILEEITKIDPSYSDELAYVL